MLKKVFSLLIVAGLIFFTSTVFATNNTIGDSMNKAGNTVKNVVGGAENVVENAAGAVGNGVRNVGNSVADGAERMTTNGTNSNSGYTTTRTGATNGTANGTFLGMTSNTWTWFILAIAAIAIVGLVWYYAMKNKSEYNYNNR